MKLVRAAADDLPDVVELMNIAYRRTGTGASWNVEDGYIEGPRIRLAELKRDAARPGFMLMLWREADGLSGCVSLEPGEEGVFHLGMLAVRPDRQASGAGRALLGAGEKLAAERGAHRIRLTVLSPRETLIAWYLRRGYAPTGATEPFPYGDTRWGRPLRDGLYFVILEKTL